MKIGTIHPAAVSHFNKEAAGKADFTVDIPPKEEERHFTIDEKDMVIVPCP